ncbi:Fe(3+)-hydroxamate ABC transporter permease FhuB [Allorhizobium sp. BGMRC 0089]|uniref:Fe(3+)-hydroxamate ABC transporter permease FhuB n=1 Tax=Allorhizobium sonneratiae TaxID=2934936 RepID=UPI002034617A|nr:Fe(3+)-hydroxamate ABC transporter permease FhuB [Allorhizobium sonneratiae]MCM2294613.1 Fe(3+)-hydroxamate ABC transporter permease FhuB [Allorhizobium sonneratiae]
MTLSIPAGKIQKRKAHAGPAVAALGLTLLGVFATLTLLWPALTGTGGHIAHMVMVYSTLPRLAMALLCGAALSLSGALFQQALRNPLASPTTLGVSAGAHLALVVVLLAAPSLIGVSRDLVALSGSALAAALVFLLGARRQFSPFALVMAGLVVSLWCGTLAMVLTLLKDRYLASLFVWGAGSLSQQSWVPFLSLAPKIAGLALLSGLLLRPLALVELGEAGAAGLGVRTVYLRVAVVAIAVALSALVVSAVGVIGFIGLVAPALARLSGARRTGALLLWSALIGGALLFAADACLMALTDATTDLIPTGAVTALFGSPLLLVLLPRLKARHRIVAEAAHRHKPPLKHPFLWLLAGAVLLLAAVFLGRALAGGWSLLEPSLWAEIMPLRLPRVTAAFVSGAMLAAAGVILQRLTGNEMASPEVLGISSGATFGVTIAVFFLASPGIGMQIGTAALGASAVLAAIFLLGIRSGFAPERVLLAGIAVGAMVEAVIGVIGASGDPRAMFLLRWMSGSTYGVTVETAIIVVCVSAVLLALTFLTCRWLDLLPLGPEAAVALGVPLVQTRLALLALAALLSAAATLSVGPLSFIGLMAPHLAREAGYLRAKSQMIAALLFGGLLMTSADWLGRMLAYPYEIPSGLVSALIGAPLLVYLMRAKSKKTS